MTNPGRVELLADFRTGLPFSAALEEHVAMLTDEDLLRVLGAAGYALIDRHRELTPERLAAAIVGALRADRG